MSRPGFALRTACGENHSCAPDRQHFLASWRGPPPGQPARSVTQETPRQPPRSAHRNLDSNEPSDSLLHCNPSGANLTITMSLFLTIFQRGSRGKNKDWPICRQPAAAFPAANVHTLCREGCASADISQLGRSASRGSRTPPGRAPIDSITPALLSRDFGFTAVFGVNSASEARNLQK